MINHTRIERIKRALRKANGPLERIDIYNDPREGSFIERIVAMREYDQETARAAKRRRY